MVAYIADRVAEFKLEGQFREILKRNDPDTIKKLKSMINDIYNE